MLKITLKGGDVREVMENTTVEALCREISMGLFRAACACLLYTSLSDSRFQMLSGDYEQEQEELREKLLRLNEEINEQEKQAENIDRFIDKVRKYLNLDELTPTVLNDMVKAVYVHAPDKSKGYREQQIDISYDLVGILPASLLNDLQNGETA